MGTRSRTRPDTSKEKGYITQAGYRKLEEEAHDLWNNQRAKLAKAVQVAAAEGDRSENAEYHYSKKKLAALDRRLRHLGNRLDALTIVSDPPPEDGRVYFGSWVQLEGEDGTSMVYRLVGPDETDSERGFISVESPVAKALLKKEEGDEVEIKRPKGDLIMEIVKVSSSAPKSS